MATKTVNDLKLQVKFKAGTSASGKPSYKNFSINKIKLDATDDQLLAAGNALIGIASFEEGGEVLRIDYAELKAN